MTTLILRARNRTLAQSQDPEDKVEHSKTEGEDSIADKLGKKEKNDEHTFHTRDKKFSII